MEFRYQATDATGKVIKGVVAGQNQLKAHQSLEQQRLKVIKLMPVQKDSGLTANGLRKVGASLAVLIALMMTLSTLRSEKQGDKVETNHNTTRLTIRGVVPQKPVDHLHICCLGATTQIDRDVRTLGKPGQPFELVVEVPPNAGEISLEASCEGQRWPLTRFRVVSNGEGQSLQAPPLDRGMSDHPDRRPNLAERQRPRPHRPTPQERRQAREQRQQQLQAHQSGLHLNAHHHHRRQPR